MRKEMCTFVANYALTMRLTPLIVIFTATLMACTPRPKTPEYTPWGTTVGDTGDTATATGGPLTLSDIVAGGEMIALTVSGPKTYYDYHGHGLGLHYLLCERLSERLGVKLRVEVCKDTAELAARLAKGEGDIVACPATIKGGLSVGPGWTVGRGNRTLADEIRRWYRPAMLAETERREKTLLATGGVTRHVYAPMLNRQRGLISRWDAIFQRHAPTARLDWRLLAAQCYQESTFDPRAHSWAGACGLMQIMPSTAAHLGLPLSAIYDPEQNIAASARYMRELMGYFPDAETQQDRISFALASYNGGHHHIADARALTRKHGGNPRRWSDVAPWVLRLAQPQYYTDPCVAYGYMRGSETADYVARIMRRWQDYGGRPSRTVRPIGGYDGPPTQPSVNIGGAVPHAAKRKHKYAI